MITQAIKGWLRRLFAWGPRKQSMPIEYQQVASVVARESLTEIPHSKGEGIVPQPGSASRLSTLDDQSEFNVRSRSEPGDPSSLPTSFSFNNEDQEPVLDSGHGLPNMPTAQQRLEFLRYLVQRGIVNEGFEKHKSEK